ncbi:transcriptional coactivator p15/PC4 family protein [Bradyrhizobium cosmicum]|uniref:transcriptional coactivator p15/PC4 family protein n=1 Tax=Bradyrhizobium cosmicum TaxID=1404864 RepID=UPI0028EA6D62|nr:transcriptional coactivator p15/PC4 family protein [Bradyrhizobium cosmicum]
MKNPASRSTPRAGFSISDNGTDNACNLPETTTHAQGTTPSLNGDGIGIASFWKSPRNRREAVQVSLRQYEQHPYADFRVYAMDESGRMRPTSRGISIGLKTLPQFCKAAGDALRKATALNLITAGSTS